MQVGILPESSRHIMPISNSFAAPGFDASNQFRSSYAIGSSMAKFAVFAITFLKKRKKKHLFFFKESFNEKNLKI